MAARRVIATDETGRVPALEARVAREAALRIVDDVAATLDGADVLVTVAAPRNGRAGALQNVRRAVSVAAIERVACQLFAAHGRKRHGSLPHFFALRVLVRGEEIESRRGEREQHDLDGFRGGQLHALACGP